MVAIEKLVTIESRLLAAMGTLGPILKMKWKFPIICLKGCQIITALYIIIILSKGV